MSLKYHQSITEASRIVMLMVLSPMLANCFVESVWQPYTLQIWMSGPSHVTHQHCGNIPGSYKNISELYENISELYGNIPGSYVFK